MNSKALELYSINQLCEKCFFIPKYQRGYRWSEVEVKCLLDDISEFTPEGKDKTWYCLQPLVTIQCNEQIVSESSLLPSDIWYEVIDGQQRLTTIFLVLTYLNSGYKEGRRKRLFKLRYATREGSQLLLAQNLDAVNIDDSTIDSYYISQAYETIKQWFYKKGNNFNINDFESKFHFSTKVIWYESSEPDSIAIFTRINAGKIPLTNSELIKALFLNRFNFKNSDANQIALKQLEIATEWDRIEYSLQDREFWYFINEGKNDAPTRIEFIFDLMVNKTNFTDDYFTFRRFSEKFHNDTREQIAKNWREVKEYFRIIEEWFVDRERYHKIGFLIATGTKIDELIGLSKNNTKSDFIKKVDEKIKGKINVQLSELQYKNPRTKSVLLLFNILTMLKNKEDDSRFSFFRYKEEKWDIEHIHSVQEEMPKLEKHRKDWLKESAEFIEDTQLRQKAELYNNEGFEQLYEDILNYFNSNKRHEDINDISNLVLLDSGTNRGYKNAIFPVKRKTIIEKEKNGVFVPLCTKNVFMKHFSKEVEQMTFWGENDQNDYFNDMLDTLQQYLPKQNN